MLAYILALAVGLGSLGIYLAAFFFPEVHRKNDFIWSGVGLFYALILWVCAGRITGGLLLGQVAGVALLGWSVTQTLQLRRQLTPRYQQTELPSAEEVKNNVQDKISDSSLLQRFSQLGKQVSGSASTAKNRLQENLSGLTQRKPQAQQPTDSTATGKAPAPQGAEEQATVQIIDNRTPTPEQPKPATATEAPTETPLGAEPAATTDQPAGPDMPGSSGKEPIPVEEIAPEVELAPPAEPPGSGDPQDRQNPPLSPVAMEAVPIETPQMPPSSPSESESSPQEDVPEPIRPNPPDPELVEAAIEDAEEKHQEASPPESVDPDSAETNK
jgi:hypothetical protein